MNKVLTLTASAVFALILGSAPAVAQQHPVPNPQGAAQAPVAAGTAAAAQGEAAHGPDAEHAEADAEHHPSMLESLMWPTANFLILAFGLWWFFKEPMANYLRDRHGSIRHELVEAANIKAAATAQLAELERKLQALPGEIDALRTRGAEEIAAEERRISAQAAADRDRLLEQTRREIEVQLRLAKRDLVEHTANLSVQLAGERIQQQITAVDQARLVDRYLDQVKGDHRVS